jgi:hypothetical protein
MKRGRQGVSAQPPSARRPLTRKESHRVRIAHLAADIGRARARSSRASRRRAGRNRWACGSKRKQAKALTGGYGCPKNTRARCWDPDRKTPVAERAAARRERGARAARAPQSTGFSVSHVRAPARLPDKMGASIDPNSRETRPAGGKYAGGEEPCDRF